MKQVLILMQGWQGSGKSTIAKQLAPEYDAVIYSTDDYFEEDGKFDFRKLGYYHHLNLERTKVALLQGKSVIVDNTNIKRRDCKPYVEFAVNHGIEVKFIRAAGNFKNIHNVPEKTVQKMKAQIQDLSVDSVLNS